MRLIWAATVLLPALLAGVVAQGTSWTSQVKVQRNGFYPLDVVDKLENTTMSNVETYMKNKIAAGKNNGCTLDKAGVRREWGDMTDDQRSDFINATLCLMKAPSKAPKDQYPGARSRYDDFVAYHLSNAQALHDSIGLFPAHKYFLLAYETALRKECGYKGYHPYMNYDRYTKDPQSSALFNGNMTSMGGNGLPDPKYSGFRTGFGPGQISSGGGGGCVTTGPFKDYNASVGPVAPIMDNVPKNPLSNGTGYNPRCMRRDVNAHVALGATADRSYNLITQSQDITTFYNVLLSPPTNNSDPYNWGIHTSGHYIAGGDPGGDPYCSPGDPIFYFHHAMLDRLWWIWQMQDPEKRLNATVNGADTTTRQLDLKWLIPDVIPVLEAHDALGGHKGAFCHVYV